MAWATRANLESRYGATAISDLETGGASVAYALSDAQSEAEGYISAAVELPFVTVPDSVVRIVCTIARYNLWRRDLQDDHPAYIAYKDAIKELQGISNGAIKLFNETTAPTISPGATPGSRVSVFTDDVMELML